MHTRQQGALPTLHPSNDLFKLNTPLPIILLDLPLPRLSVESSIALCKEDAKEEATTYSSNCPFASHTRDHGWDRSYLWNGGGHWGRWLGRHLDGSVNRLFGRGDLD